MFRRPRRLANFPRGPINTHGRLAGRPLVCATELNRPLQVLSEVGLAHGCRRTRRRRNSKKPSTDRRRILFCAGILQNYGCLSSNIRTEPVATEETVPKKLISGTVPEKVGSIAFQGVDRGHDRLTFRGFGRRVIFLIGTTFLN